MKNVFITTLGCKVNQYESAAFKTAFTEAGHRLVGPGDSADIVVVNTCSVTAKAGLQSRQAVRQAVRKNPQARILITGCHAEAAPRELEELEELQGREYVIIGNSKKDCLVPEALSDDRQVERILLGTIGSADKICDLPVKHFGDRTRAYLRVQDGCESFCTYCIVPYTRGPSRSLPFIKVLDQAKVFVAEGYKEIVLTGIHLGYYGKDLTDHGDIADLIDKLSSELPTARFRISSLEPTEITDRLLALMQERANLTPHLHIPLQSGDDEILEKMGRRYTTGEFRDIIDKVRSALPHCAIGIDLLAGFPGETENHFQSCLDFVSALDVTYLHVFPYSKRPGTVASGFKGDILKDVKHERVARLRGVSDGKKSAFYRSQLGRVLPVLAEGKRDQAGLLKGFSDNYVQVHFVGGDELINTIVDVRLLETDGNSVTGEVEREHENRDNRYRR